MKSQCSDLVQFNIQYGVKFQVQGKSVFNGYTLYYSEQMSARAKLPGETKEQCRQRVMAECRRQWSGDASLRQDFAYKAKALNREHRESSDLVPVSPQESALASASASDLKYWGQLRPFGGTGAMGVGDKSWGLSQQLLQQAEAACTGFVRKHASEWKSREGKPVEQGPEFRANSRKCCQEAQGFCCRQISDMNNYKMIERHVLRFVVAHRRKHLVGGKNKGPNALLQHPLLLLRRTP